MREASGRGGNSAFIHHNAKGSREVRKKPSCQMVSELPPVSWTTKIKSKKQEAFHVRASGIKT